MRSAFRSTEIAHSISIFTFVSGNLWILRINIAWNLHTMWNSKTKWNFEKTISKRLLLLLLIIRFRRYQPQSHFCLVLSQHQKLLQLQQQYEQVNNIEYSNTDFRAIIIFNKHMEILGIKQTLTRTQIKKCSLSLSLITFNYKCGFEV